MKRFRVVSCVICFLLAAVVLMPCALAAGEFIFVGTATCSYCGFECSVDGDSCGERQFYYRCPNCKHGDFFTFYYPCVWSETGRTEPTTVVEGIITYTCSSCGEMKTEIIPKLEPVNPDECTHDWQETSRTEPSGTTPGQIIYTCSKCGEVRIETISPVRPPYDGTFTNWLGSVLGLFSMTLNHIMGFRALQMFVGVLVFLIMFSLLAKLVRQGRRGRL